MFSQYGSNRRRWQDTTTHILDRSWLYGYERDSWKEMLGVRSPALNPHLPLPSVSRKNGRGESPHSQRVLVSDYSNPPRAWTRKHTETQHAERHTEVTEKHKLNSYVQFTPTCASMAPRLTADGDGKQDNTTDIVYILSTPEYSVCICK